MGFYFIQNNQVLNSSFQFPGFSGRPTGRPSSEVGRPTCTDVHACSGRRDGRPTRSTVQRALLSGKAPVDRPVDRTESSALCILATVDRPVDRCPNGRKNDRWRSTGRSTDRPSGFITASFWSPINWAIWGLFSTRFLESFWASFSTLLRGFLH